MFYSCLSSKQLPPNFRFTELSTSRWYMKKIYWINAKIVMLWLQFLGNFMYRMCSAFRYLISFRFPFFYSWFYVLGFGEKKHLLFIICFLLTFAILFYKLPICSPSSQLRVHIFVICECIFHELVMWLNAVNMGFLPIIMWPKPQVHNLVFVTLFSSYRFCPSQDIVIPLFFLKLVFHRKVVLMWQP